MKYIWLLMMVVMPGMAMAAEIEGVSLPDTLAVNGRYLHLNGAGVRTKFFFDIYVGALYRQDAARRAGAVLTHPAPSAVSMDFLYGEVDAAKLQHGWQEGFRKNQTPEAMRSLQKRLDAFNALFGDARKGDRYRFDFLRDGSTVVRFNDKEIGRIDGEDFQRALLAVWLGEHPADADLKNAMLGGE